MDIVLNLLTLLAIVCVCLAGAAGVSYLVSRRRDNESGIEETNTPRTDGRNNKS